MVGLHLGWNAVFPLRPDERRHQEKRRTRLSPSRIAYNGSIVDFVAAVFAAPDIPLAGCLHG